MPRQSNKSLRIFILILGVVIVIWSVYQEKKPNKTAAELEYRMVTGERDGTFQVIMFETSDRFFVLDSNFKQTFETNDAEVVSRPEQLQLLSAYKNLQYRASLSIGKDDLKKQVRMSRELFNILDFNAPFTAVIHPKVKDSLSDVTDIHKK